MVGRYGIDFHINLLIHFINKKKIKYWQWLYMEGLYSVYEEYGFKTS